MESLPPDHFVRSQQFTPTTHREIYPVIDPSQAALSQKGKVVVITGASQGLGARAFAKSFAHTGPKAIVLVARRADQLEKVAESIKKINATVEILVVPTDIADLVSVASLFEKVKEKYGHADVLVNNAGVFRAIAPVKDIDPAAWWADMTLNVYGTFLVTQGFLKLLPTPETPAKIVTLTTGAAYEVFPALSAYGISKLGAFQLSTFVAAENPNVTAVALHPGVVDTDMTIESFMKFALDKPELVGGVGTWLAGWQGESRKFLSGRFVSVNWDVDDLVKRKEEIVSKDLLKMDLQGEFGAAQFGQ